MTKLKVIFFSPSSNSGLQEIAQLNGINLNLVSSEAKLNCHDYVVLRP